MNYTSHLAIFILIILYWYVYIDFVHISSVSETGFLKRYISLLRVNSLLFTNSPDRREEDLPHSIQNHRTLCTISKIVHSSWSWVNQIQVRTKWICSFKHVAFIQHGGLSDKVLYQIISWVTACSNQSWLGKTPVFSV